MKLSIITINRNNAEGLRKTIESVVSQTYTDFEYIIIDGASTDCSVDIIKEYAGFTYSSGETLQKNLYWVSEPDSGIFNAMNKGIKQAKGDYLLFLNSGDWFADEVVVNDFMCKEFTASIISGDIYLWQNNHAIFRKSYSIEDIHYGNFYRGSLPHAATFIKKKLFEKYGLYTERYRIVSDWEFFLKVLIVHGCDYTYFDRAISYFDLNGISNADETRSLQNEERLDVLQSIQPLFYKSYKLLIEKYDYLLSHEQEYQEYMNLKNGKFSLVIKLILMLKKIKVFN